MRGQGTTTAEGVSHARAAVLFPLHPAPVRSSVVDQLMARIAVSVHLGLLQPGERLPRVEEIGAAVGAAPITVRRALAGLIAKGILVGRRGRQGGTFVAAVPDPDALETFAAYRLASDEVYQLIDQRLVLESGMAHLAAERATAADVARLEELVHAMDRATSWAAFRAHDPAFHLEIAAIAGSERAAQELLTILTRLVRFYLPYPMEYLRRSNDEHRALVGALARGDGTAASALAARHVRALNDTVFVDADGSDP